MPQTHVRPTNTIAQLLFARTPVLDFPRLVGDLDAAFRNCPEEGRALRWDHDDLAVLDVQASRIILSFAADLSGAHAASLTVGVGYGPGTGAPGLALRQSTIARMIVERIAGRHHPDTVLWQETAEALDETLLDRLTAAQDIRNAAPLRTDPRARARFAVDQTAAIARTPRAPSLRDSLSGADRPALTTASRVVMKARDTTLVIARMSAQAYEITRGRLERARDPQVVLRTILGLPAATEPRIRPRRVVPA